jgi:hypothetical protein
MANDSKKILIVYSHAGPLENIRLAIKNHLKVMEASDYKHDITYYNAALYAPSPSWEINDIPQHVPLEFQHSNFDAVILFDTFLEYRYTPSSYFYKIKKHFNWVGKMDCLKIAMPQDEYDHSDLLDEWLFDWGISVIFSNFDETYRHLLYPILQNKAMFYKCFTGYVDDTIIRGNADKLLPIAKRKYDIIYRASKLPYWFGNQGQLKYQIGDVVADRAGKHGLYINISTRPQDTILGDKWLDFLASGKTVLGCESGSSVLDRRGEIQSQIRNLLHKNPRLTFTEVSEHMPAGWDDYNFYAISPRHFEAISTKTCQVLIEGHYDDVLTANRHYIPLKRDYSNLDEILEKLKDGSYIQDIIEKAYQDICLSGLYNYKTLSSKIEQAIINHEKKLLSGVKENSHFMVAKDKTLEVLERQLVAERHTNAYLQAKIAGEMESKFLRFMRLSLVFLLGLIIISIGNIMLTIILLLSIVK